MALSPLMKLLIELFSKKTALQVKLSCAKRTLRRKNTIIEGELPTDL
jgi:hypothetical protein